MKLTDALLGEHAVLYELFEHARRAAAGGDAGDMRRAVSVLDALLLSHARVEEDLLFPALDPHLGQMGPLAVMRSEHQSIERLLASAHKEPDPAALKAIVADLLDLAHGHFQKEEMALFPMARRFLDEATLARLGDQWADRRKVNISAQGCMSAA